MADLRRMRPESADDDTPWGGYWIVSDLHPLPKVDWRPIDTLRTIDGQPYAPHPPKRPVAVTA